MYNKSDRIFFIFASFRFLRLFFFIYLPWIYTYTKRGAHKHRVSAGCCSPYCFHVCLLVVCPFLVFHTLRVVIEQTSQIQQRNINSNNFLHGFALLCLIFRGVSSSFWLSELLMRRLCANLFHRSRNWKLKHFNFFFIRFSINPTSIAGPTTVEQYRLAWNVAPSSRAAYRNSRRKR